MRRALILMSDTGGAHRACAEALKEAFAMENAGVRADVIDLWADHTPWPVNRLPRSYSFVVQRAPAFYAWLFAATETPSRLLPLLEACGRWSERSFLRVLRDCSPDLLISAHPLLQTAPLRIMARQGIRLPFFTVVTDLVGFHPSWFDPAATLCFVPSQPAYAEALRRGLRPDQLRDVGMPIRLDFALERPPRHLQRARLGIASDLPSVMLTGGGEGMGRVEEIAHAIAERLGGGGAPPLGQMVIVCGRNDRLRERLSGVNWPAPVCVTGFVSNMVDWMSACDLVVTKAGPGTIAEAMSLGLPVILSGHLPGQEAPNVGYVTDNGFGVYEPEPDGIACLVARWLGPESAAREVMGQRARGLARPGAARGIADEIGRAMAALPAPGVREVGVKATGS